MKNLHHVMLLQYLMRITSELEIQLQETRKNLNLQNVDAVDIIDFVETRAAYEMAVRMEKDIIRILSWHFE